MSGGRPLRGSDRGRQRGAGPARAYARSGCAEERCGRRAHQQVNHTALPPPGVGRSPHRVASCSTMNIPRPVVASVVGSLTIATSSLSSATVTVTSSRSEEHTSELQSLMRISYAVFCLKKKKKKKKNQTR